MTLALQLAAAPVANSGNKQDDGESPARRRNRVLSEKVIASFHHFGSGIKAVIFSIVFVSDFAGF